MLENAERYRTGPDRIRTEPDRTAENPQILTLIFSKNFVTPPKSDICYYLPNSLDLSFTMIFEGLAYLKNLISLNTVLERLL